MSRPTGSKNKPKEAPRSDGITTTKHNEAAERADLTEDQQRANLALAVTAYQASLKNKNDYVAEHLKVCKRIKGDGVDLADVKTAIALQTPEGEAKLKARMAAEARVARWYGSAIGTQFGLFEDDITSEDKAFQAGKRAGLAGEKSAAPDGFELNEFLRGWQIGQAALMGLHIKQKERDADEFDAVPESAAVN